MADIDLLSASNGNGEAVASLVTVLRTAGSTVLTVDFTTNWPAQFIATTGKLLANNTLDPSTTFVFKGHLNGATIVIDAVAPGYTDTGSAVGDIVLLKPTTLWADLVAAAAKQMNTFTQVNGDWRGILDANGAPVVPTVISSNGQKEHVIRFASVDYSGVIPVGGKLRIPRTGTTPTTSMAFAAASSQYASKSSPAGLSGITGTFTIETTVNVGSYPATGANGIIGGVTNSSETNGFKLRLEPTGQWGVQWFGAGINRYYLSHQSITPNKDTHIAAVVTVATNTVVLYMDGVAVAFGAASVTGTGMVAGSNIYLGGLGIANTYANITMVEFRVWSSILTATQLRDNAHKQLVGNEAGLAVYIKGNGSWNDSTANANHLTAAGGAINNFASHPFSAVEFGFATKVAYDGVNNRTDVTVFMGNGCLPNQTLGATSYSTARAPYGFPTSKGKWCITTINKLWAHVGGAVGGTIYTPSTFIGSATIPTGEWILSLEAAGASQTPPTSGVQNYGLSYALNGAFIDRLVAAAYQSTNVSGNHWWSPIHLEKKDERYTGMQSIYPVVKSEITVGDIGFRGEFQPTVITAECAYL